MKHLFKIIWVDSDGENLKNLTTRDDFLKKVESFLSRGYDCRIIIKAKDNETDERVRQLFEKYSHKYIRDRAPNAIREGARGALSGARDSASYAGVAAGGMVGVQLGADTLAQLAEKLAPEMASEVLAEGLVATAEFLTNTAEFAAGAAELTSTILGPAAIIVTTGIRGFRMYQRAKDKEDDAVLIYTFKNAKSADSQSDLPFPKLSPIPGTYKRFQINY